MKYLEEFQNPELARRLLDEIRATVTRPWALMEVCGGHLPRSAGHRLLRDRSGRAALFWGSLVVYLWGVGCGLTPHIALRPPKRGA
ncbi:hypothetical protein Stube_00100 [Streptomyces tubercidicus]|uniref:Uncharacterized protein n=1 Tax=Streptomyces tubercidicus TaxID=47759 RepID=A0A640UHT7_9ACTN|nr:hypothetical protein Stube_00100 [Streptomyces tubercidicus]